MDNEVENLLDSSLDDSNLRLDDWDKVINYLKSIQKQIASENSKIDDILKKREDM